MRVESCGPLFAEPTEGDIFFSTNRLSEPIPSIINPKNNNFLVEENEDNFFKLNEVASPTVIVGHGHHPLPVGFVFTDEEWSLFRQPDFGLVKLNMDTMSHLSPNINSPLASLSACSSDFTQSQELAPEFKKPQELEGDEYSGTCSGQNDEFNNNNNDIVSKMFPFAAKSDFEGSSVNTTVPDEYASATPVQGEVAAQKELDDGIVRPLSLSPNSEYYDDEYENNACFNPGPSSLLQSSSFNYFSENGNQEINPNLSLSWNLGGSSVYFLPQISSVDTIGSHPQPIPSLSATHGLSHHNHDVYHHNQNSHPPIQYPNQKFDQQAMRAPGQEIWMEEYEQNFAPESYFEDWQSQSMFLSSEVDKAKLKWHQQQNNNNTTNGGSNNWFPSFDMHQKYQGQPPLFPLEDYRGRTTDDTRTLKTFLSKFDNKVAAIWGQNNQPLNENRGGIGVAYPEVFPYSESYLPTCSTPVSNNMYPWASPTPEQNHQGSYRYDMRAMQNQIEQQQLLQATEFQKQCKDFFYSHSYYGGQEPTANSSYPSSVQSAGSSYYVTIRKPTVSRYYHTAAPGVDPAVIMPPTAKDPLSNTIRRTFGIASIKDGYRIVKAVDNSIPAQEMENSLTQLSHDDDSSAFKRVVTSQFDKEDGDKDKDRSELEIITMQVIFGSLDLVGDEDQLEDYNWEVHDILKLQPPTFYEQHIPEVDLLKSWATHFTPIDVIETVHGFSYSSPPGILPPGHENNPDFPEFYTLFSEVEYNIFLRSAKALFPVRFKLCPGPEKSIQTESRKNSKSTTPTDVGGDASHHDPFRHRTAFDWSSFGNRNNNNEDYLSVSSGSRTPLEFKTTTLGNDKNNVLEIKTTDWYLNGRELPSGSGFELEYDYDNGNAAAYGARFPHSDYCCDSGIGIDGSSRAGFYDDLYSEYDGVDFDGVGGMALQHSTAPGDNDVDYGQFQSFPYNTWSTSSASGKAGKQSRRRMKGKPCKYFLADGTCKRGNNCKFSHDLTTCRYWAEGSCLKGDGCPYMHCFLDGNTFGECKERRRAGKRYHLESDNDFPALGAFGEANSSSKNPISLDMPQLSSSLVDGAAGSSAEGSLLMLADPAGSMYDSYGFGFGLHPADRATYEEYPLPIQEQQQLATVTVPYLKPDLKRSGNGRSANGKSQSGSSWARQQGSKGSNNNNWISSMISVKEKRKKKKQ